MKLKAITINTFIEATRNKIFYLLIVFGVICALSSQIISYLVIEDSAKVIKDVGLASINFFSVLIAVFTGINLVYKEIDKKTIYNIISKPISRSSFIIGKFLGLATTLLIALISMFFIFFIFLFISTGQLEIRIFIYFLFLFMELLIVIAISVVFSSFSTPILSSIFTISLYLIGQVLWTFNQFKGDISSTFERALFYSFYYILPNLEKFNIKSQIVMNTNISAYHIWNSILYAVVYVGAVLILAILIFNQKEFK
jgi:ABC-type transport system involved in multi-copper enzyme maturation permease subunit